MLEDELDLGRRAIHLPMELSTSSSRRAVAQLARAASRGDREQLEARLQRLVERGERWSAPTMEAAGIDWMRAMTLARVIVDLVRAGWGVEFEGGDLFGLAPHDSRHVASTAGPAAAKQRVRGFTTERVREQLAQPSERSFVEEMERQGILSLAACPDELARRLHSDGVQSVQPFLQLANAAAGDEDQTGIPLHSVFRYFRWHWSFPYADTPGRSLPVLIRDGGHPRQPVCGLLCLSSPVLQLTPRDRHLGLSVCWLQAIVRSLDVDLAGDRGRCVAEVTKALQAVSAALRMSALEAGGGLTPATLLQDFALLLGLQLSGQPAALARQLLADGVEAAGYRVDSARRHVVREVLAQVRGALDGTGLHHLGLNRTELFEEPEASSAQLAGLEKQAIIARERLLTERGLALRAGDERRAGELKAAAEVQLYIKKRARKLARLLRTWDDLQPLRAASREGLDPAVLRCRLREAAFGSTALPDGAAWLQERRCLRGLRAAVAARKVSLMATRVADVSVCGAVPPYGPLLGGKLAAMLALSGDLAGLYHEQYTGAASEIESRMAGAAVRRSANLVALTTSSFFSVGSAQYNRVRLPQVLGGIGWTRVGRSRGYGTLQFSSATVDAIDALLQAVRGHKEVNATFGEGPSERLRKIRMGLELLGLPADELLRHGEGRILYVADLHREAPFGLPVEGQRHHQAGPSAEAVSDHWRERWLAPRLERGRVQRELVSLGSEPARVSALFPEIFAGTATEE